MSTFRAHQSATFNDSGLFVPAAVPPFVPGDSPEPVGIFILGSSGWQATNAVEYIGPAASQPAGTWRATSEAIYSEA